METQSSLKAPTYLEDLERVSNVHPLSAEEYRLSQHDVIKLCSTYVTGTSDEARHMFEDDLVQTTPLVSSPYSILL